MNGIHDMGGMHGFGPVAPTPSEPPFEHEWQRHAMAMFAAVSAVGLFNVDEFRHTIEKMDPAEYLGTSYYEHWLHSLENLMLDKGVITQAELDSAKAEGGKLRLTALTADQVDEFVKTGGSARVPVDVKASYEVGDQVKVKNINPVGHTRMPRYVRGKVGSIVLSHGVFVTPDTSAHGLGDAPQHVYAVSFEATELWGSSAAAKDKVIVDLWDNYLEKA